MSVANTWQWRPNWAAGITERLEWRTDVQQAYSGAEQRYALRPIPRRVWTWEMTLEGHARQEFERLFWHNATGTWLVPLWWDVSVSDFAIGDASWARPIVPDDRELPALQYLVIQDEQGAIGKGPYTTASVTIGGIPHYEYSWTGVLTRAFTRAKVHPARLARVTIESISNVTAGVATYRLRADATDDESPGTIAGPSALGTNAFLERPERSEAIEQTWELLDDRIDFGGAWQYDTRLQRPLPGHVHRLVYGDRADVYRLRKKLHGIEGRFKRVAVPTYEQDLIPVAGIASGTNALDVRAINWSGWYSARGGRENIVVFDRSGAYRFATIVASSVVGDIETLTLAAPWPSDVALSDIRCVSWAELARLDSDAVEIVWTTPHVAQVSLPWRVVP